MVFQPGNDLARLGSKPREFQKALRIAVSRPHKGSTYLQRIADKVTEMAVQGEIAAIREVADRLDGKPDATLHTTGDVTLFEALLDAIDRRRAALNGGSDDGCLIEHEPVVGEFDKLLE